MTASNSVFINYRRTASAYLTLAIYQELSAHNIDSFYDVEGIASGQFGTIILNQIAARPYFMPILTPGTLERCKEAGDWVLREMQHAMQLGRVFVPIYTPEFRFEDIDTCLPADLAAHLKSYNMMELPQRFFKYAMQEVRERFLKPITLHVAATPTGEVPLVIQKQEQLATQAPVTEQQLTAQAYFTRGWERLNRRDLDGAIADYTEAIRHDPAFSWAYNNRGLAHHDKGDLDKAIADYNEAIRLDPKSADTYYNRGFSYYAKGDFNSAIVDFTQAIRLAPQDVFARNNRGYTYYRMGQLDQAVADCNEAIRLDPDYAESYNSRGEIRDAIGDHNGAAADYRKVLELRPDHPDAVELREYIKRWG